MIFSSMRNNQISIINIMMQIFEKVNRFLIENNINFIHTFLYVCGILLFCLHFLVDEVTFYYKE